MSPFNISQRLIYNSVGKYVLIRNKDIDLYKK